MTTISRTVREKICPSCGTSFDCAAGDCWCDDVLLAEQTRTTLRAQHADCLCPSCLRAAADGTVTDGRGDTDLLMLQFLRWVAERPRTYADVMEAWRTSCPRMSIWEDAQADGLVRFDAQTVGLTPRGIERLRAWTSNRELSPTSKE